jgi:hypothetical protein
MSDPHGQYRLLNRLSSKWRSAMRRFARRLVLGIRTPYECYRNDFSHVWPIAAVSVINSSVRLEGPRDAAVIIHHQVGILPVAAELEARAGVIDEVGIPWPVVHVEVNSFAISRKIQVLSHTASHMQANVLSPGSADVSSASEVCFQVHPASAGGGLNLNVQKVIAALGVRFSPALPVRKNVKFAAEIKGPGSEDADARDYQYSAQDE